jgi:hypothetical protein
MVISAPGSYARVQTVSVLSTAQPLVSADELAVIVADQRSGQEVGLAQDLEAVADPEHRQPLLSTRDHRAHHRCETRDRAATQVVAVGEAAGQDDRVDSSQVLVTVPQRDRLVARKAYGARRVHVVERAGKGDDPDLHRPSSWAISATVCSSAWTS